MAYRYRYKGYRYGDSYGGGFFDSLVRTFFVLLFAAVATVLFIALTAPRGVDGASQIFGHELRIVESDSMQEHPDTNVSDYAIGSFKKNTMVALELVPENDSEAFAWYESVQEGDVLTVRYTYDRQVTITHRVISKKLNDDGTGYIIKLQGDNLNSNSAQLTQEIDTSDGQSTNYVIGRVVWKSYPVGVVIAGLQRVFKAFADE